MGTELRKEKDRETRRNDIIEASEKLFIKTGYERTSMDEIAKNSEFTKRSLYFYFSGKDEILIEILIKAYRLYNSYLREKYESTEGHNGMESIRLLGEGFMRFYSDHKDYYKLIAGYETKIGDFKAFKGKIKELYALGEVGMNYLIELLKKGIKDRSIRKDLDAKKTALSIWLTLNGVCYLAALKEEYISNIRKINGTELIEDEFKIIEKFISS